MGTDLSRVAILKEGVNINGIKYSKEVIESIKHQIDEKQFFGELRCDEVKVDYFSTDLSKASHQIINPRIEDDSLIVEIKVLDTHEGNRLRTLVDSKASMKFSAVGMGTVNFQNQVSDYRLLYVNAMLGYAPDGRKLYRTKTRWDLKEELGHAITNVISEYHAHKCTIDLMKSKFNAMYRNKPFWSTLTKCKLKTLRQSKRCSINKIKTYGISN